ncbi:hypothetical protein [Actinokineospora sp. NPDC004072]
MTSPRDLGARVVQPQRRTAARLSLLGGDDDRLLAWDAVKGITAPAEFRLVGGPPRRARELAGRAR